MRLLLQLNGLVGLGDAAGQFSVAEGPISLADSGERDYCACSKCKWGHLDIFLSLFSPSLWETA